MARCDAVVQPYQFHPELDPEGETPEEIQTLQTCGSGAVAGSCMFGTDPFRRVSVEAQPALYWPLLLKQSDVKWLAHAYKLTGSVAGCC